MMQTPPFQRKLDTLAVRFTRWGWVMCIILLAAVAGCSSDGYLKVRKAPKNPLEAPLKLLSFQGPQPTERTEQLLRQYDLDRDLASSPVEVLQRLEEEIDREPTPEKLHAFAELAYIQGAREDALGRGGRAVLSAARR